MLPVLFGHIPAGASTKQLAHFGQLKKSGKFQLYDYGMITNILMYHSLNPPAYNLSKIRAPIAFYYSINDWLADVYDVYKLQKQLPNVKHAYIVPMPKFNHLDFIFANDVKKLLYDEVIKIMKSVEHNLPSHKQINSLQFTNLKIASNNTEKSLK